jgi:hypothetical protein
MYLIDSNHTQCQWNDITVIGSALQGKDILNPDAPRNGPNACIPAFILGSHVVA